MTDRSPEVVLRGEAKRTGRTAPPGARSSGGGEHTDLGARDRARLARGDARSTATLIVVERDTQQSARAALGTRDRERHRTQSKCAHAPMFGLRPVLIRECRFVLAMFSARSTRTRKRRPPARLVHNGRYRGGYQHDIAVATRLSSADGTPIWGPTGHTLRVRAYRSRNLGRFHS